MITIQAGTPEPSPHTPCAVIAEPRRLARKPLSKPRPKLRPQEPPQAVTARRSQCFRNLLLKPSPGPLGNGPWCGSIVSTAGGIQKRCLAMKNAAMNAAIILNKEKGLEVK